MCYFFLSFFFFFSLRSPGSSPPLHFSWCICFFLSQFSFTPSTWILFPRYFFSAGFCLGRELQLVSFERSQCLDYSDLFRSYIGPPAFTWNQNVQPRFVSAAFLKFTYMNTSWPFGILFLFGSSDQPLLFSASFYIDASMVQVYCC